MTAASGPDEIHWSWGPGESRLAVMAQGCPLELAVERPGMLEGTLCLGRVTAIDRRQDGAFVALGAGDAQGFLAGARTRGLAEGAAVLVRVTADASGGKAARLSADCGGLPPDLLAAAGSARAPAVLWRPAALERLLARHLGIRRVVVDDPVPLAEARRLGVEAVLAPLPEIDDLFEAALTPVVPLPSGGRLVIEPCAALTAIDVDSGGCRPADANAEAVAAIARQLRLRGIGGQIAVDFVSGPKGTPHRLAALLKQAVAADPVPTHVRGVSPLGLVELTRERRGTALAELLCRRTHEPRPETLALAALRRVLAEAKARPAARLGLVLAPEPAAALAGLPEAVAETERRLGRPLPLRAEAGLGRDDVMIEELK